MTAPGPHDPPIAYRVHRGVLIGIMLVIALSTGFLVFSGTPDIQTWVISAIQAVRDVWTSWDWSLW